MRRTKLVREGDYLALVSVEYQGLEGGWGPCLSLDDAFKLDDVRAALSDGNVAEAARLGIVYKLKSI